MAAQNVETLNAHSFKKVVTVARIVSIRWRMNIRKSVEIIKLSITRVNRLS
ncbi:MAG: hypothetical protein R3C26_03170 [Calditrichia bacterium]